MKYNWPTKKLGEIVDFVSGNQSINKSKAVANGKYPAYSASGQDIFLNTYENEGPAIIVSWIGARCGKCFLVDGKWTAIANTQILKIKNENECDYKYLFYFLNDEKKWPRIGGAQPYISKNGAKKIEIPLPPLEIQKQIVARIEELFEKINRVKELREKAIEETEQIFLSALQEVFSEAEKKWKSSKILEISEKRPQYGYTASAQEIPVGPKFLRITDIQNGQVDWDKVPYCKCNKKDFEKYKLEKDDILFARTGATTGKTYLVKECPMPTVFASYLIRLKVDKNKVFPDYVYIFFQSPQYWRQVIPYGGAQPNMNAQVLSKIQLPLPPLSEQKRIVAYLDDLREKVEKLKKLQEEQLKDLEELKKSILEKAFSGEMII